jgi:5'-nucleotidase
MVKKLAQYYHMKRYKNVSKYIITLMCTCCVACTQPKVQNLTILHSNDTHSQVESLEEGKRDAHCGGYARRMGFITQQRELDPNILLLDGGDFCQGTPYFNFYHGRVEVEAMNYMKYDVVTLGNHEFDYGVDTLAAMLKTAKFDIVCANYDVTNSPLEDIVKPYTIIRRGNLRIGVFGIGVEPTGLITEKNFHPLQYLDPVTTAQEIADMLKNKKKCDIVICISHQGTHPGQNGKMSDIELAEATRNIDIIIGAHSHKIVNNLYIKNQDGDSVLLAQVGKAGARIGKIELKMTE